MFSLKETMKELQARKSSHSLDMEVTGPCSFAEDHGKRRYDGDKILNVFNKLQQARSTLAPP
jgi:hypothetical protein